MRPIPGSGTALLLAAWMVAGLVSVLWLFVELDARTRPEIIVEIAENPSAIHVGIENGVESPGVYELPAGARMSDLLEIAGGPNGSADLASINLAERLDDNALIRLPEIAAVAQSTAESASASQGAMSFASTDPRLDLNTATFEALDGLPGIGPALAQAILDERERRGGFESVDDLADIPGISERMVDEFRHLVTVSQ